MAKLKCVVVTPEKTEIDREVDSLVLPLYDGAMGVLPGRAPLIGRLGFGQLELTDSSSTETYFVDGGFAQVENNVVSILTGRAMPVSDIVYADAEKELAAALQLPANTEEQRQVRDASALRARGQMRISRK
ncbi:ATP synthase epsilon chain, sodium ion specific [Rosistilla ulvae]|uniref:ATP synthase epsilon chain n=1 Tax=Rosistilla ulvae TaxID=1930277 RepID=A0A517M4Q0_9BACT|nr:ATP synthase F1 subunit epsilon [Rosistilla ulvae]QDS89850.1 ATP synthase epsilon chain, sodium ion specific [Rosistilla ulvae]